MIDTLRVPDKWQYNEQDDCKYAYEDGFYDGRDEAFDSLIEISPSNIAEWLIRAIKDYGKQDELVNKTMIAPQTLTKWKHNGTMPRFDLLYLICQEMGYELCLHKRE